ncbi:hypothetical protein CK203_088260 [Vitis vinifera]|uniref:Transposon Ty3-I Gag-Pol polyprotein n=1 Tax=Vitis vinifera TaxID=29760 RepID=A0A438FJJ8_VITVI|nr:hypothetical protein CK203_088260 [Vitis vinifera]
MKKVKKGSKPIFVLSNDGILRFRTRLCVPNDGDLKRELLEEADCSRLAIHPRGTKMYKDLRQNYWWLGSLQPLSIPEWKWEHITMDFVVGLPRTLGDNNTIWVIVDRFTKSAHFLPMKINFSMDRLASLYVREITDGQLERVIQVLEDLLRACTLDLKGNVDLLFVGMMLEKGNFWGLNLCS